VLTCPLVRFIGELGVGLHPEMAGLDVAEEHGEGLVGVGAEQAAQLLSDGLAPTRAQEGNGGDGQEGLIEAGSGFGPRLERAGIGGQDRKLTLQPLLPFGGGLLEQLEDLARLHAQGTQSAAVTDDAVGDAAVTGKVGEELLLEDRRKRILDVGGEGLLPEVLQDGRDLQRRREKGGEETEAFFDLTSEFLGRSHPRRPLLPQEA
jgi:hypothetical protein